MACTAQDLVTAASKLQGIPTGMQTNIATAVACQLAGIPADPQALVDAAKCLECGKTEPILMAIAAVCNLSSGGGSGTTITLPTDTDGKSFICTIINTCYKDGGCTSVTNCTGQTTVTVSSSCLGGCTFTQSISDAIDTLVTQLKTSGLWDLMDVIYPFVGGTANTCALNLKNPSAFAMAWHGGLTFSSSGVTGDGSTGYGDTGFVPTVSGVNFTLNSAAMGVYIDGTNTPSNMAGAFSIIGSGTRIYRNAANVLGDVNNNTPITVAYGAPTNGNYALSRTAANLTTLYVPSGATSTDATAPLTGTAFSLYVLSANFSNSLDFCSNGTIKFMWAGAGLSGAQIAALETIITTFETALGRA